MSTQTAKEDHDDGEEEEAACVEEFPATAITLDDLLVTGVSEDAESLHEATVARPWKSDRDDGAGDEMRCAVGTVASLFNQNKQPQSEVT
ncbi:hypothetical protein ABZP36_034243 [Zizania latifolia]